MYRINNNKLIMACRKTLFTGFSPNITKKQIHLALQFLFFPWKWGILLKGDAVKKIENKLADYFRTRSIVFDSGRSALYFALKSLNLEPGHEVLVQAYTCVVVINSIIQAGCRPVYLDIGDDFNIDAANVERKITGNTRAIIIQHTFGSAADLDLLLPLSAKHNLAVIEDCAHSLGATYKGKKLGTFGDMAILSFGSDKIISCVRGGALLVKNQTLLESALKYQNLLPLPHIGKTIQHLVHLPIFYIGKKLYSYGVGKALLFLSSKLRVINKIIYPAEKQGKGVDFYPSRLANSLGEILMGQLENLEQNIQHRKNIAKEYYENIKNKNFVHTKFNPESAYLRYTLLVDNPEKIFTEAKKSRIMLGDWYSTVIAPKDVDMSKIDYANGSCSKAEKMASQTINLPTDQCIKKEDADRIIQFINACL